MLLSVIFEPMTVTLQTRLQLSQTGETLFSFTISTRDHCPNSPRTGGGEGYSLCAYYMGRLRLKRERFSGSKYIQGFGKVTVSVYERVVKNLRKE